MILFCKEDRCQAVLFHLCELFFNSTFFSAFGGD